MQIKNLHKHIVLQLVQISQLNKLQQTDKILLYKFGIQQVSKDFDLQVVHFIEVQIVLLLFMIQLSNKQISDKTFNNIQKWKKDFYQEGQPSNPQKFPIILLGNMLDMASQRTVTQQRAREYVKSHMNMMYFQTSAKQDLNVEKAFQAIARSALKNQSQGQIFRPAVVTIRPPGNNKPNNRKTCCSK